MPHSSEVHAENPIKETVLIYSVYVLYGNGLYCKCK